MKILQLQLTATETRAVRLTGAGAAPTTQGESERVTSLDIVDPVREKSWDDFVESHPLGSTYHHSSWLNVLLHTYHHLAVVAVTLKSPGGALQAALPLAVIRSQLGTRLVSMSFTPYCDPLVSSAEEFGVLVEPVVRAISAGDASRFELRVLKGHNMVTGSLTEHPFRHKNHVLNVEEGIEKVRANFHRSCIRHGIRKAIKSGVTVREAASEEDMKAFFRLHSMTRRRLGLPIQPYALFQNMWRFMYPGRLTLLIAERKGEMIGGLITFKQGRTVSLEHIGYDEKELPFRPNHLLYYTAIERACHEGDLQVDFGKTSPNNAGLLDFKRRWGAEETAVSYFFYPESSRSIPLDDDTAARRVFKAVNRKLPLPVAQALGWIIYRQIG
jgi:CelD/BcsL family acetyltransferase involved in cellulose biosynthesis